MQPSLTRTLHPRVPISEYPRLTAVQATARALGCTPETAAQVLKPADPRCPFVRGAMVAEALLAAGHGTKLDTLCLPLDLVRQTTLCGATPETFAAALEAEAVHEGAENVAQLFVRDAASYSTWRKRAVAELTATLHALRVGDALYGAAL
jgi:hypothetical protein